MDDQTGLTWRWSRFALGVAFALPAVVVTPFSSTLGLALAVGVLPAAAFRLPPRRRGRAVILLVGTLSAVGLLVGSLLATVPAVAVVGVFVSAVLACINAAHGRVAQLVLVLVLPMIGIGLSFSWSPAAVGLSACIVVGTLYAWLVSLLWPERDEPPPAPTPVPRRRAMLVYGLLLGTAAAIAAAMGFLLDLEHVGWATAAVLLVMRPVRGQLIARSIGRAISVLVGALAAAAFALLAPGDLLIGMVIGVVVGALCASQESRWYVAPGFTTFIALTFILVSSSGAPGARFLERAGETLLGVGLALFFGAAVPSLLSLLSRRRRSRSI
ncbi:MAG: hypothetical protein K0Q52_1073 [Microbacterium sp.]|nr:hypothetical protein [Microbacterium sp.]